MDIYLFIFFIIACLSVSDTVKVSPTVKNICLALAFLPMLIMAGLRWKTGNDWIPYYEYYRDLEHLSDKADDFEVGYRAFAITFKTIGLNYIAFLFVSTLFYLSLFYAVFRKQAAPVLIALLFFATYLLGWMGTARQVIAMGFALLAGQCLIEDKKKWFFFLNTVAFFFHNSAAVFFLAYLMVNPRPSMKRILFWVIASAAIGQAMPLLFDGVLGSITGISGLAYKVQFYSQVNAEELDLASGPMIQVLWYVKRLVFLAMILMCRRYFTDRASNFYFNGYVFSVCLFLILQPILPMFALRLGNYFSLYELFLLASLVPKVQRAWAPIVFCCVLALAGQRLYTALFAYLPDIYMPYKGVFINEDVLRAAY